MELPSEIIEADQALHRLYERISFSRYLNPTNIMEARQAFKEGFEAPPFEYLQADWAEEEIAMLDSLVVPATHPFGILLIDAIASTRLYMEALSLRTADVFDELAVRANWYPDASLIQAAQAEVRERDTAPFCLGAQELTQHLRDALETRGLIDWKVDLDSVMSARVLVDGAKRLLRVNSRARFRERDVAKLIVHEVEVHAIRAANGDQQPLRMFGTGLPGALETEEGLALLAEERSATAAPGGGWRQGVVVRAIDWAREMGFRELFERICEAGGESLAWGISLRLKRGLKAPEKPGVYAKDVVYYKGLKRVRAWLDAGNPVEHLFVGKVGIEHPVAEWLEEGLLDLKPVPQVFLSEGEPAVR
ncbi:MAG: tyrosine/phenylalanine carboxypeptidase domain-containing protein [Myxococcota bacterium]|nr:tyrosine/phenylalanine carboxypeptidase domain-containing protein [Myxococcota bacterium]